jgi:uncharacterized membrane protein
MSMDAFLAIAGMAGVTLAIRAGGYLLAERLPADGFAAAWLRHIPGAVLAALVAPSLARGGLAEWGAAALAVIAFALSRSLLAAVAAGIGGVYLLRLWLG